MARRVYAGDNKALEGRFTVVVGHDVTAGATPNAAVALPIHDRAVDVTVAATPFGASTPLFEGIFELRSLQIEKLR